MNIDAPRLGFKCEIKQRILGYLDDLEILRVEQTDSDITQFKLEN